MYLFSRRTRLRPGQTMKAMTWALEQTERVNRIVDTPVSLYSQVFSPDVGTLAWSSFVPDLATLESAEAKLMVDEAYVSAIDSGADFFEGGVHDSVVSLIHGEPDPKRQIEYVSTVRAICASGNLGKGMAVGVEICELADSITGLSTLFGAGMTGPYGSVGWFTGHADIASVEESSAKLVEDPRWLEFIDREAGTVYQDGPSATMQTVFRRLA